MHLTQNVLTWPVSSFFFYKCYPFRQCFLPTLIKRQQTVFLESIIFFHKLKMINRDTHLLLLECWYLSAGSVLLVKILLLQDLLHFCRQITGLRTCTMQIKMKFLPKICIKSKFQYVHSSSASHLDIRFFKYNFVAAVFNLAAVAKKSFCIYTNYFHAPANTVLLILNKQFAYY